jgi:hypothetical protein
LFYIIVGIIVAAIALFLIFHPTSNGNSGPKTVSSAQQVVGLVATNHGVVSVHENIEI